MITHATPDLADTMAPLLRAEDAAECVGLGYQPAEALRLSVARSVAAWAYVIDGQPVAAWGAVSDSLLGGVGRPWLLTTQAVERHRRLFMVETRRGWASMRPMFARWENWVDDRYGRAMRWLRWLGFALDEPRPVGVGGLMYRRFWWEAA